MDKTMISFVLMVLVVLMIFCTLLGGCAAIINQDPHSFAVMLI